MQSEIKDFHIQNACKVAICIQKVLSNWNLKSASLSSLKPEIMKERIFPMDHWWIANIFVLYLSLLYRKGIITLVIPQCKYKIVRDKNGIKFLSDVQFISIPESMGDLVKLANLEVEQIDEDLVNNIKTYLQSQPIKENVNKSQFAELGECIRNEQPWSYQEEKYLLKAIEHTQDIGVLCNLFQRSPGAITSRLLEKHKLDLDFQKPVYPIISVE